MPHPVDIHVGQRLRHRRWSKGMTQKELASAAGVQFQQIQKYENGANRVSASRLWILGIALDVPISFFFQGLPDTNSGFAENDDETEQFQMHSRETMNLLRGYYQLDENVRRRILDLIRTMNNSNTLHDEGTEPDKTEQDESSS